LSALHTFLLARLHSTPGPFVGLRELPPHTDAELRELKQFGMLVDAGVPEEITLPPGHTLRIKKIGTNFFGLDDEEECPRPQRLTPEDVTQYRIAVPAFAARLVSLNQIEGTATVSPALASGLYPIGRKSTPDGMVNVWLAVALGAEPFAIAGRLAQLAMDDAHARHVVIFPRWPDMSPADSSALSAKGVHLADLDPSSLHIRWPDAMRRAPVEEKPDCALSSKGATWQIDYFGESVDVADSIGMNYIALLMSTPDGAWSPFELQAGRLTSDAGVDDALKQGLSVRANTQADLPRASAQSVATAELTLRRFAQEIEKLQGLGRDAEADEIQEQAAQYAEQNAHLLGAGGRVKFEGDRETARLAVRHNVDRALKAISKRHERLGKILRDRVRLSPPLSFNPLKGEVWVVRFPRKIRTSRPKSRK